MVEEIQVKTVGLSEEASKIEAKLAEEARLKEIADTIKRHCTKRLDFNHRDGYKRSSSFKGNAMGLFETKGDNMEFRDHMKEEKAKRPTSKKADRKPVLRPI